MPRKKLWAFRIAAILLAFAFLAGVELSLRAIGLGPDVSLVIPVSGSPKRAKYQLNELVDLPYLGSISLRGPEERRFDLPKPKKTYRILVFGASTVAGFPYPFELSFPRHLEVLLQAQATGWRIEVLNAGITAINSFALADMVPQGLVAEPDLIIVHAGHNEFYGPGGAGSSARGLSPSLFPWIVRIKKLRTSQLILRLLASTEEDRELLELLPETLEIPWHGETVRAVEARFRANLEQMVRTAIGAGVPILLTTVACNLRDQGPIHSLLPRDLTEQQMERWKSLVQQGERRFQEGQWQSAQELFEEAETVDKSSALVAYRLAQCLDRQKRWNAAREAYARARDLDGCRLRAPSTFSDIVRQVAESHSEPSVHFFDTAADLQERLGPEPLGHNVFLEHVHYNLDGHWQLALSIAHFVQTKILQRPWSAERVPSFRERNELLGATAQDELFAHSMALEVLQKRPMKDAVDVQQQIRFLTSRIRELYLSLSPADQQVFADLPMSTMDADLLGSLAWQYERRGRPREAIRWWRRRVRRRPWSPETHWQLARALAAQGQTEEASRELQTALELAPHAAEATLPPWADRLLGHLRDAEKGAGT
ncbi:MAG: tetratricopeptide repeat protein [Planctomycetes bacterium]|nr:tetratricopeptide repeat protein [Planctomycetota bacterium]